MPSLFERDPADPKPAILDIDDGFITGDEPDPMLDPNQAGDRAVGVGGSSNRGRATTVLEAGPNWLY